MGLLVVVFGGFGEGYLFKVHTRALKGMKVPTLLFATILNAEDIGIDLLAVSKHALFRHHR